MTEWCFPCAREKKIKNKETILQCRNDNCSVCDMEHMSCSFKIANSAIGCRNLTLKKVYWLSGLFSTSDLTPFYVIMALVVVVVVLVLVLIIMQER